MGGLAAGEAPGHPLDGLLLAHQHHEHQHALTAATVPFILLYNTITISHREEVESVDECPEFKRLLGSLFVGDEVGQELRDPGDAWTQVRMPLLPPVCEYDFTHYEEKFDDNHEVALGLGLDHPGGVAPVLHQVVHGQQEEEDVGGLERDQHTEQQTRVTTSAVND